MGSVGTGLKQNGYLDLFLTFGLTLTKLQLAAASVNRRLSVVDSALLVLVLRNRVQTAGIGVVFDVVR